MKKQTIFKQILAAYFEQDNISLLDSSQIINNLGLLLGDDVIYGALKNGDKYLINSINKYANKANLGQIIISNLYKLIDLEIKLSQSKNLQIKQRELYFDLLTKQDSRKLDEDNKKLYDKLIKDCDYFLSDVDNLTIYDKEVKVSDLTDYQKLCIIFEITNSSISFYHKNCSVIYDYINSVICKNILGKVNINLKNRSK